MYRDGVRYHLIAQAASELRWPVLANGNVSSTPQALELVRTSGTRGLMLGRGVIRILGVWPARRPGQYPVPTLAFSLHTSYLRSFRPALIAPRSSRSPLAPPAHFMWP